MIAVATAIQESRLLVLGNPAVPGSMHPPPQGVGRDHDSVGLFGQRGTGWGPLAVRMDPRGSARLFYQRLRGIPHWQRLPLTQAADAVQHSALPTAYEQWEPVARRIVGAVSGVSCRPGAGAGAAPDGSLAAAVAARALATVGTPYVWGGGDAQGPTAGAPGVRAPPGGGFDCSGLMVFAFAGIGVSVPHQTQAIWTAFAPPITDRRLLQPGDMLLFSDNGQPSGIHHVGLYLGGGERSRSDGARPAHRRPGDRGRQRVAVVLLLGPVHRRRSGRPRRGAHHRPRPARPAVKRCGGARPARGRRRG